MSAWQAQLYRTVLIVTILAYLFMYTYRHVRGHFYSIREMDAAENLARVLRDRFLLYVFLIVFLAVTRSGGQISRKFLLLMAELDVVLDYGLRMLYRWLLLRSADSSAYRERFLLVTEEAYAGIAVARLRDGFAKGSGAPRVVGIAFVSPAEAGSGDPGLAGMKESRTFPDEAAGIRVLGDVRHVLCREYLSASAGPGPAGGGNPAFNRVYVCLPNAGKEAIRDILGQCDALGMTADVCLTICGDVLPKKMILAGAGSQESSAGAEYFNYAVAEYTNMRIRCKVLGVRFAVTNVEAAACFILRHLESLRGQYICFSNVHTTVMAREDPSYCAVQNMAAYTFADGAPIAAVERSQGFTGVERCAGPDFMDAVFRATMDGRVGHYFYGSTQETVDLLKDRLEQRYPGIRICGTYAPPFRALEAISEEEDLADIQRINDSGAAIIWIGLGAPKQERWMAAHRGKLSGTMFGVGAGFNFYAGNVKRAPKWVQKMGLEWLFRLLQDPKRLFNRYFVTNFKFVWYLLTDRFRGSRE